MLKRFLTPTSKTNYFLLGIFVAILIATVVGKAFLFFSAVVFFIYFTVILSLHFKNKKESKIPRLKIIKTKEHKDLVKIKKKRLYEAEKKHEIINNQFAYISGVWKLSKDQHKSFITFIEKRAYSDLYTKMTASLLPQLIKMIDACLAKKQVGCKRDVSKRINELVIIMKEEIKRKKSKKSEDFETMSQVYDHLINELK